MSTRGLLILAFAIAAAPAGAAGPAPQRQPGRSAWPAQGPSPLAALKLRYIGPEGNRVSAVAGVPGDPRVYYAGAASGGIFKSSDGGVRWDPVFDDQPVS